MHARWWPRQRSDPLRRPAARFALLPLTTAGDSVVALVNELR